MNVMYRLPVNDLPLVPKTALHDLRNLKKTLLNEVMEINEIIDRAQSVQHEHVAIDVEALQLQILTDLADMLGKLTVTCRSEAMRYGIPLEPVLDIVMDSNVSNLDENHNPLYNTEGKPVPAPTYWSPHEKISELLVTRLTTN
jgi:hypothetical protein